MSLPLSTQTSGHSAVTVSEIDYRGWKDSLAIHNASAEVIVVPATGRVMQFHFAGEEPIIWENQSLAGNLPVEDPKHWTNFGGDKSWPSPQDDWQKMIGRGWPPPFSFDQVAANASVRGNVVELEFPIDPAYGIRQRREIDLDEHQPVLRITTTYEKVSGAPVKVAIGVITQLTDPERAFMVLPEKSQFPKGYVHLQFSLPENLTVKNRLVSLTRGHDIESQIGSDAGTLLWMNQKYVLRIDSPRVEGAEYADHGSSAVIYTGANPNSYVELETFGPLTTMKPGDTIQRTNTYTLSRRTDKNPEAEAKKIRMSSQE